MIDFRRESAVTHPTEGRPLPVLFSSQQDHDTQRLYRLYDFSKSQIIHPDGFCCVAGKVNSADKLYLVIESVKRDTQHQLDSNALAPASGSHESAVPALEETVSS